MEKEEIKVITLTGYEHGLLIRALNELRNGLIREERSTDAVDELLLKTMDAPARRRRRERNEAR